jgi:hypothetical protein
MSEVPQVQLKDTSGEPNPLLEAVHISTDGDETVVKIAVVTEIRIPTSSFAEERANGTLKIGQIVGEMVAERIHLDVDTDLVPAIATKVDEHFAEPAPAA